LGVGVAKHQHVVRPSLERVKPTPQGSAMKALVAPKGHRKLGGMRLIATAQD